MGLTIGVIVSHPDKPILTPTAHIPTQNLQCYCRVDQAHSVPSSYIVRLLSKFRLRDVKVHEAFQSENSPNPTQSSPTKPHFIFPNSPPPAIEIVFSIFNFQDLVTMHHQTLATPNHPQISVQRSFSIFLLASGTTRGDVDTFFHFGSLFFLLCADLCTNSKSPLGMLDTRIQHS